MPAKHIQIARDEGMEAGLTAFLSAQASRLSPNWQTVVGNGRRSDTSMLKHYESCFSATVGKTRASKGTNPVLNERTIDDKQALIEQIAESLGSLGIDAGALSALMISEQVEEVESDLVSNSEYITRDVAWMLLGANDEFRSTPANRGEVASSGQLFRLNAEGLISTAEVARLNEQAGA